MTKPKKAGATPRLRFPEFRTSGWWTDARLGDLFSERQESGFTSLPLLSVTEADGVIPQEQTNRRNVSAPDKSRYLRVVPGDIAYNTMRMWEGRSARVGIEGVISPAYTVCVPGGTTDSHFFSYYFKTKTLIGRFRQLSQGLVKDTLNLNYDAFSRIRASVPPDVEEQRKIVDCLTSLDDVIAAQAQKVDALRAHKQGLMQQLFPREGETIPPLRFPEFGDSPEWELHRLADFIATLDAGVSVNGGDRPAKGTEIGVLKTSAVSTGVFDVSENKVVFEASESGRVREPVRSDTIIISRMNTPALVGASAYVERDHGNVFLPDRLWAAKGNGRGDMRYLSYVLGSAAGRFMLSQLATGTSGSMKNISKSAVLELVLTVPEISEQLRIASCLSSLDEQIAADSERLEALRSHKVGLMQQLFPSPNTD